MKRITLTSLMLLNAFCQADDTLAKMKAIRSEMVAKATAKVYDDGKRNLEQMLAAAIRSGKADQVLAISDDIAAGNLTGKTFYPKKNTGFAFTLGDAGVCWQVVGGQGVARWTVSGGKLHFEMGNAVVDVDAKTLEGTVQYRDVEKQPHPDTLMLKK